MTAASLALIAVYLAVALLCVKPVGLYISNVMEGRLIWPLRVGARVEALIYRLCGVEPATEMGWKKYAIALVLFNALGALALGVYVGREIRSRYKFKRRTPYDYYSHAGDDENGFAEFGFGV